MDLSNVLGTLVSIFKSVSDFLGVQWAPTDIPMNRRLQTLAATGWICLVLFGEALGIYLLIALVYSNFWWLGILYCIWMVNDIDISNKGGRRCEWVRNWAWWRFYRDYFPMRLVKTAELDPSRNYLLAVFPHGVISCGAFGAFATNALGFNVLFPGMTSSLITLRGHFLIPFFRDLALALGGTASSQESIMYMLDRKKQKGNCAVLIVGGAAEALDSHPGEYKVILNRRKGFVRVAMLSGAPLVPVISFGETDVFRPFNNPEDSFLRRAQEKVRQWTGISPMFPLGRGMLQYSFGVVPLRSPVTTVVGSPMDVQRNLDPTDEQIEAVHAEFKKRLIDLFETEKSKYLPNPEKVHLTIT